jgi:ATP phosphoribosyltransferase
MEKTKAGGNGTDSSFVTADSPLRIAIPNKGRLMEPSLALLSRAGVSVPQKNGSLFVSSDDGRYEILFARAEDVPRYVESGAADCGITGLDMVEETGAGVQTLCELDFGMCRVSVAGKKGMGVGGLEGKAVATRLPNITRKFFGRRKISVKIVEVAGATELAPYLGIADAIVDQVSTGATLAQNGLVEIEKVLQSRAVLVASAASAEKCEALRLSVQGAIAADGKAYMMLNVSEGDLKQVASLLGGMEAPTMMPLAEKGMFALHSVVARRGMESLIARLKEAGARDILVLGIERIIP